MLTDSTRGAGVVVFVLSIIFSKVLAAGRLYTEETDGRL